eukprot:scaffold24506_cov25-Prasinocladus_malaysianus.AAC.1
MAVAIATPRGSERPRTSAGRRRSWPLCPSRPAPPSAPPCPAPAERRQLPLEGCQQTKTGKTSQTQLAYPDHSSRRLPRGVVSFPLQGSLGPVISIGVILVPYAGSLHIVNDIIDITSIAITFAIIMLPQCKNSVPQLLTPKVLM